MIKISAERAFPVRLIPAFFTILTPVFPAFSSSHKFLVDSVLDFLAFLLDFHAGVRTKILMNLPRFINHPLTPFGYNHCFFEINRESPVFFLFSLVARCVFFLLGNYNFVKDFFKNRIFNETKTSGWWIFITINMKTCSENLQFVFKMFCALVSCHDCNSIKGRIRQNDN